MSGHCAVIEAGPGTIRRLCCGTGVVADAELVMAALDAIDDSVALVDASPVSIVSLWSTVLRALDCGRPESVVVVHPSWWAASRVRVVSAAAKVLADDVVVRRRTWLLAQAAADRPATVIAEIAERFVVVTGAVMAAHPRRGEPQRVAEEVARVVIDMTQGITAAVLIDRPSTVPGAAELATSIANALRTTSADLTLVVNDARLARLAKAFAARHERSAPRRGVSAGPARSRRQVLVPLVVVGIAVLAALAVRVAGGHGGPSGGETPTTFLVEGRVALTVPAQWSTQRVVDGPGSARVQVTSPSDPEVALHVTQSPVSGESLTGTAESLKRAIDVEPAGVFIDFNPSGRSAGRPAVTYREVRAGHDIRWTVLLDGSVRISLGCQSRHGGEDAIRDVCEQAVRSVHALG